MRSVLGYVHSNCGEAATQNVTVDVGFSPSSGPHMEIIASTKPSEHSRGTTERTPAFLPWSRRLNARILVANESRQLMRTRLGNLNCDSDFEF